jgi:hypothetical protein
MPATAVIFLVGALSTAEICAAPIVGGRGEPDFCRLNGPQRIDTPFLAVTVDSDVLIGVDQGGRRISIQFSARQNQAGLLIQAIPLAEVQSAANSLSGLKQYLAGRLSCEAHAFAQIGWQRCVPDRWREEHLSQYYLLRTTADVYYVEHYASELGRQMDPVIGRILESLIANGI